DKILIMIKTANRIANVEEYYFSRKLAEVRALDTPELRVINLGIGSPDMAPSVNTISALIRSAEDPANHGYQNYRGIPALRQAIATFYNKVYGVSLDAENGILPLMGSKEGIMHIAMAFVNEGDEILIPDPGYPTYASVGKIVGAKTRTYEMKESLNWGVDVESLKKQDLSKVRVMWVNFPHMPTGKVASRAEVKELVDLIKADPTKSILISTDGTVQQDGQILGRIAVVEIPQQQDLQKLGSTYFQMNDVKAMVKAATGVQLQQGRLEGANGAPAEHAVRLVSVMRQFEMLQKALSIGSDMNKRAIDEVARVS
ncbi:MAG: aminotransferase class I/II-fold pyridoxal phosphate-dependent enzyme, partial [Bryobacteraceae bacterium]